ncbi:MAG: tRNA pseudouridine(38-40) synthase TruA [Opitutales bacterium]
MPPETQRWKCVVGYDGTAFNGWQSQPGGNTIQDILERRLAQLLKTPTRIQGCSRTDAGVHARGQVFHFDGAWPGSGENLVEAFRSNVPDAIRVLSARPVSPSFHAMKNAKGKQYVYRIFRGQAGPLENRYCWSAGRIPQDTVRMRAAASLLVGTHDFRAFAGTKPLPAGSTTIRRVWRVDLVEAGPRIRIIVEGEGFLYKMVRGIAGCLISVGRGRVPVDEVPALLTAARRTARVETAPARGLCLEKIWYHRLPQRAAARLS